MSLTLHHLKPFVKKKKKKRIGRGNASGHGTYSTRGQKGQKARSGGRKGLKLKALRKIWKKIPKKSGFRSFKTKTQIINLKDLEKIFPDGEQITPQKLWEKRMIKKAGSKIKILSQGNLSKKFFLQAHSFSKKAEEKIKKAGGQITKI